MNEIEELESKEATIDRLMAFAAKEDCLFRDIEELVKQVTFSYETDGGTLYQLKIAVYHRYGSNGGQYVPVLFYQNQDGDWRNCKWQPIGDTTAEGAVFQTFMWLSMRLGVGADPASVF